MHALVIASESFIYIYVFYLADHFKKYTKERSSVQSLLLFFFKSFVAVAVTHNAVNGLETVSSGDVKQSLLNERMLVAL